MISTPSASYSFTARIDIPNQIGMFSKVTEAIAGAGGDLGAIDIVRYGRETITRDITVNAADEHHAENIVAALKRVAGISVVNVSDRTFLLHLGGKIEVHSKTPLKTRDQLSMAYTPGVARICKAIAEDPSKAFQLTIKGNTVAVVTDGSAVLGLGDIGPEAAMPVMEGKAMLFKEFGGVDAFPICLNARDPDEIVRMVTALAPTFGGINLEDIAAPRCFEIEEKLQAALDIPVFHDDQHGTAIVVLAALLNAAEIVGKRLSDLRVVINGIGAAGAACTKILMQAGVGNVVGCDRQGAIHRQRPDILRGENASKVWYAEHTNPDGYTGNLCDVIVGADVFIGVSAPEVLTVDDVQRMAKDPIVFALANPVPEIAPEDALAHVAVMATGRSDYPNQINNVLAFPGLFKGALSCRARKVNEEMKLAAAYAIRDVVRQDEWGPEYIMPSVFDERVAAAVAKAVVEAAERTGVARRRVPAPALVASR
ncbi:MAG TPA: NAD-dependent malic enzyme [Ktedonobacterales bacterium]